MNEGIDFDLDIYKALKWLSGTVLDPSDFLCRMERSQEIYIENSSAKSNFGKKFDQTWFGDDLAAAFFAQAKSLLDNRKSFEISTASNIIPWVKQLGKNIDFLEGVVGASERAKRMLENKRVYPDTALFELIVAANYAEKGYYVEFLPEKKGLAKTPEFKCSLNGDDYFFVECKRLQKSNYSLREESAHCLKARPVELRILSKRMSVWIDVTYKREIFDIPEEYVINHLTHYYGKNYYWDDEYGTGFVKSIDLKPIKEDIERNGSILANTKMARLIKKAPLYNDNYDVYVSGRADERDVRFISKIKFASLLTWRCIGEVSYEKRSRHITSTLAEIEQQISSYGLGIGHVAIDVDVQTDVADKRREKNFDAIKKFEIKSKLVLLNIHYLVPRIDENRAWLVDETREYFYANKLIEHVFPGVDIFPNAVRFDNDLPGWHQK